MTPQQPQHQPQQARNKKPRHRNRPHNNRRSKAPKSSETNNQTLVVADHNNNNVTRVVHAPGLGPDLPQLVITYTNDQQVIADWLQQHIIIGGDVEANYLQCLGLDTESKPTFTREAYLASKGPDVLQLAKADGNCLVIHLCFMEKLMDLKSVYHCESIHDLLQSQAGNSKRNNRLEGYRKLASVLNCRHIAKAGVGLEADAVDLYENKLLEMNCRFDLRTIPTDDEGVSDHNSQSSSNKSSSNSEEGQNGNVAKKGNNNNKRPEGLKGLTEYYVPGMILPKVKRLQMSNWAARLSDAQVRYAAGDAFAAAITVHTLINSSANTHTLESFTNTVMAAEVDMDRVLIKKKKKQEAKKNKKKKRGQDKGGQKKGNQPQNNNNTGSNNDGTKKKARSQKRKNSNAKPASRGSGGPSKKQKGNSS
ncbi:expressed unknown protein [Seminavis robusta]|uniref:Uncharacterized protein n=1 Tax=Seminavis robusta TaxID=568900 RepID=A0A9N8E2Z7_9STRA|nr:expressed unknown protein [Seminavis robusta]|eukprot:Sro504_g155880.1 n/a (421) ;mRNA; r:1449-2711